MNNPFDENYIFTDEERQEMLQRELKQYEVRIGKLTPYERKCLREWVACGKSANDNPYDLYEEDGGLTDFITAKRVYPSLFFGDDCDRIPCGGNAGHNADYSTRRRRRAAVKHVLSWLSAIRDAEQECLERVPDNLQGSESYEVGEFAVDALDEILELLAQVY